MRISGEMVKRTWQPSSACPPEAVVPPKAPPPPKEAGPPPEHQPIREGVGGPLQERAQVQAPSDPTDAADASASSSSRPCRGRYQNVAVHSRDDQKEHGRREFANSAEGLHGTYRNVSLFLRFFRNVGRTYTERIRNV